MHHSESISDNCRNYPSGDAKQSIHPEDYIHCNGTILKLTDSDIGSGQYTYSDYYVWTAGTSSQLLFIFPTRVNLTTITLHYYSGSVRGLPRLRLYTVPDDFDVWDAPISFYSHVDIAAIPPSASEWSVGRRNVSVSFNVTTRKILMVKFKSSFSFALSEVEFFYHCCKWTA